MHNHTITGCIVLGVIIVGAIGQSQYKNFLAWREAVIKQQAEQDRLEQLEQERKIIEVKNLDFAKKQVSKLATSTQDLENWLKIKELDPWKHEIKIVPIDGAFQKGEVICAGPDGKFDTEDDIKEDRIDVNAKNVGVKIGRAGVDITKGLYQGVKDSIFKKEE